MKKLVVSSLAGLLAAVAVAAPATGELSRKTELVALDGKSVDRMQQRYGVDAVWVVDTQNILYRDDRNAYYLVTLKETCKSLGIRSLSFSFDPAWSWQLLSHRNYQVRPEAGSRCDVAKVAQIDEERADPLRETSHHRVW
jgi:hypothetical protein